MFGSLKYLKVGDETTEHIHVLVRFESGYYHPYISVRKLGKVSVVNDVEEFIPKQQFGPDAMAIDFEEFRSILAGRRSSIKTALMDQAALAGLGNIYTDEILFQPSIRPTRKCHQLGSKE